MYLLIVNITGTHLSTRRALLEQQLISQLIIPKSRIFGPAAARELSRIYNVMSDASLFKFEHLAKLDPEVDSQSRVQIALS